MASHTAADLLGSLRQYRLLEPKHLEELAAKVEGRTIEPRVLAQKLLERGWLTPYQANQLLQGKGQELLLGSYVLLERLGEGGMGAVFKARNWKLGQVVALKLMHKDRVASADGVKRFQREIQAAAQLNHPNIVRAFDADEVNGTHILVMEHVAGTDLAHLVREKGPRPVDQAISCVAQAAQGLAHAHAAGIVHRDIKPGNLLLDSKGTVKVLDMGLARMEGAENAPSDPTSPEGLTKSGSIMGTTDYMAPEQALNTKRADQRSDVYSLGCTLWFLLTGRGLYGGETVMEKLLAHREEPIPSLRDVWPEVPKELDAIFRRMVAKKPLDRYQSMADVIAALQGRVTEESSAELGIVAAELRRREGLDIVGDETLAEPGSTGRSLPPRKKQRSHLATVAGGLLLLALLGGFAFLLTRGPTQPASSSLAQQMRKETARVPETGKTHDPGKTDVGPLPAGFVSLFNGRDLTGWEVKQGRKEDWTVENGVLVCNPTQLGWLGTRKQYGDFVLRLEWRMASNTDSGVFLRVPDRPGYPSAIDASEIQILDDTPWPNLAPKKRSGALWGLAGPERSVFKGLGQWNSFEITCRGDRIIVVFNDEKVVDAGAAEVPELAKRLRTGFLGLQGSTGHVEFRNIAIKELTDDAPPRAAGGIDLLPLIDPAKDAGRGQWKRNDAGELLSDDTLFARLEVPYQPPAEYDLHIIFTRNSGKDGVSQVLVGNGRQFRFEIGGWGNKVAGFELVDGKWVNQNPTTVVRDSGWLTNGRRYETLVQVRKEGVKAFLDGKPITQLQTDFINVSMAAQWAMNDQRLLGLGSWRSPMTFHRVEIVEISGPGTFTRPDDPAAKKAAQQRAAGWRPLFKGKDLQGWGKSPRNVTIVQEDGEPALRLIGDPVGDFGLDEKFDDFHLRLEFKCGPGNGSHWVKYHCVGSGYGMVYWTSPQAPVKVACGLDRVFDEAVLREGRIEVTNAAVKEIASPGDVLKPAGSWNVLEIVCAKGTVLHILNGRLLSVVRNCRTVANGKEALITRGTIHLGIGKGTSDTFFRRIEVRPITELPRDVLDRFAWRPLLNGKDFDGWNLNGWDGVNASEVFTIVERDGQPALRIGDGANKAAMVTKHNAFWNYHLRLQYQWGAVPAAGGQKDLYYHHRGTAQGNGFRLSTSDSSGYLAMWGPRRARAGQLRDGAIVPAPGAETINHLDPLLKGVEKPLGQWNTLDLVCLDNKALQVLNGKIVAIVADIRAGPEDKDEAVTSGRIGFSASTGEIFIRGLEIRPITAIPPEFLK